MKDFSKGYTLPISSKPSKKGLDAKMKDFSEYTLQLSCKAFQKGLEAKMKDFSENIPFNFLLRHLKRDFF